jgi:hypothetical protein
MQAIKQSGARPHHNVSVRQGCVTPVLPCGFVLKLIIWNSWADPFYVGLTGVEVHDAVSGRVAILPSRISAMPFSSVAILPHMSHDARTPDKLVRCLLLLRLLPLGCQCFPALPAWRHVPVSV